MELTNLTHTLTYNGTETIIDEPVGFDGLKMTMSRGEYHGMSVEVSEGNLTFYGKAATIIETAYNASIDSVVAYKVINGSEDTILSCNVDLSTYEKTQGKYTAISCKIGEIGAKTTFNNRTDTDVDLGAEETIDGTALAHIPTWKSLRIPQKHLAYTNKTNQYTNKDVSLLSNWDGEEFESNFNFDKNNVNEFGALNEGGLIFYEDDDFNTKFGDNTEMQLDLSINIKLEDFSIAIVGSVYWTFCVQLLSGASIVKEVEIPIASKGKYATATLNYSGTIQTDSALKARIYGKKVSGTGSFHVFTKVVMTESYANMLMYDNLADTNVTADMLPVHEALNVIAEAISENAITVKSDWYARKGSLVNPKTGDAPGYGALKALTNGYRIRGLYVDDDGEKRNMPLSFQSAIESLNALDCIGWGFEESNGSVFLRVEHWDWFYKDTQVIALSDVAEIKTSASADDVFTSFNIGFKKYETNEDYNSTDSVHGEREFTSGIKAVSNAVEASCEFIADNYAIEETRRAKTDVDATEEFSYDEDIFVFELADVHPNGGNESLSIMTTASDASLIKRPAEFINAKLSPRHCASRWKDYLFRAHSNAAMKFTTGTINYNASFKVSPYSTLIQQASRTIYSLKPYCDDQTTYAQAENADIDCTQSIVLAEEVSFECPITTTQYNAIKANPYGYVLVNESIYGFIREFSYEYKTGMANFKLITYNHE